jgi:hypothetical protein
MAGTVSERHELHEIEQTLRKILETLKEQFALPVRATLTYASNGGNTMSALALVIGQLANPTYTELSASGASVPPIGPVTYAADASGAVTVDPNTGIVTAAVATSPGAVATVTATDAGNGLSAQATFTVSAAGTGPAVSATLTYTAGPVPASATKRRF